MGLGLESRNPGMLWLGGNFTAHPGTLPTIPGCSNPHPTFPWTLLGIQGQPQLLWDSIPSRNPFPNLRFPSRNPLLCSSPQPLSLSPGAFPGPECFPCCSRLLPGLQLMHPKPPALGKARMRRLRARWFVAYTLLHNPSLVASRKTALADPAANGAQLGVPRP